MTKKNPKKNLFLSLAVFLISTGLFIFAAQELKNYNTADSNDYIHINSPSIMSLRLDAIERAKAKGEKTYTFEVDNNLAPRPIVAVVSNESKPSEELMNSLGNLTPPAKEGEQSNATPVDGEDSAKLENLGNIPLPQNSSDIKPDPSGQNVKVPNLDRLNDDSVPMDKVKETKKIGLLSNSPFYFLKTGWQTFKGWFIWGEKSVKYKIELSSQRLAEYISVSGNQKAQEKSLKSYNKILNSLKSKKLSSYQTPLLSNMTQLQQINSTTDKRTSSLDEASRITQELLFNYANQEDKK